MSNHLLHNTRPLAAQTIRRFAVPIILAWLVVVAILTVAVPTLEEVEQRQGLSLNPTDAPSFQAAERMSEAFDSPTRVVR